MNNDFWLGVIAGLTIGWLYFTRTGGAVREYATEKAREFVLKRIE